MSKANVKWCVNWLDKFDTTSFCIVLATNIFNYNCPQVVGENNVARNGPTDNALAENSTQRAVGLEGEANVIIFPSNNAGRYRKVSDCCIICLESYQIGDIVVRSCNEECIHAFHRKCFVNYLANHTKDGTPCPACRRDFVAKELLDTLYKNDEQSTAQRATNTPVSGSNIV